jgi:hypothetical protein
MPGVRRQMFMNLLEYQKQLQFSDQWLRLGLLTEDELCALGHEYELSEDKNTEHYRYRVFRQYLASHMPLSSSMADALYELGKEDPDHVMGGAMKHDIVGLKECPDNVLEKALASGENHLVKAVRGKKLLAELNSGLTEDLFARCLESHEDYIQRELLARPELTRRQLEQLAESGCNRAVRNMAAVRLRDSHHAA